MKSNKFRVLTLVIATALVQSTCVYAASDKKDGYTKDELNSLEPGYEWKDIDKSNYKTNSYTNSFSSATSPEEAAKNNEDSSSTKTTSTSTTTDSASNTVNTILKTVPSTGIKGDYWGKTSSGKWMLFEQGVPVMGWKMVAGKWYYMDLEGVMQTGWLDYGENWYYLNPSGAMASNAYVDGYYLDWNGVMR